MIYGSESPVRAIHTNHPYACFLVDCLGHKDIRYPCSDNKHERLEKKSRGRYDSGLILDENIGPLSLPVRYLVSTFVLSFIKLRNFLLRHHNIEHNNNKILLDLSLSLSLSLLPVLPMHAQDGSLTQLFYPNATVTPTG